MREDEILGYIRKFCGEIGTTANYFYTNRKRDEDTARIVKAHDKLEQRVELLKRQYPNYKEHMKP